MKKLLLGCGEVEREGWTHVDVQDLDHVDVQHDLRETPWPFDDDSAAAIYAVDVVEHLPDTVAFMDEAWRVLAAGGELFVQVPHYQSENAWRDPTHVRAFHPTTFDYFDPETRWGRKYGALYTDCRWQVVRRHEHGRVNIQVWMTPRK